MTSAWLGLGSNQNAPENIRAAMSELSEQFEEVCFSPAYKSRSVGFDGEDFINLVARVETQLSPLELRGYLRNLEDRYGRKRDVPKFSDRSLDVDILLYGDLVLISPLLEIPRAEILTFIHVLKPLADLEPELVHPLEKRSMAEILISRDLSEADLSLLENV